MNTLERENNQLRADLKQCAEAMKAVMDDYSSLYSGKYGSSRTALAALSLPSVQAALKEKA